MFYILNLYYEKNKRLTIKASFLCIKYYFSGTMIFPETIFSLACIIEFLIYEVTLSSPRLTPPFLRSYLMTSSLGNLLFFVFSDISLTTSPTSFLINNLVIELYKYQAESDRKRIKERQAQGIALAKEKGKFKGRKLKFTENDPRLQLAFKLYIQGATEKDVERQTGINRRTFQRYRNKFNIHRK